MDVVISDSYISNSTARDGQGGFASISKGRWFNLTSTTVVDCQAPEGRIMIVQSQSYKTNVSISLSQLQCN